MQLLFPTGANCSVARSMRSTESFYRDYIHRSDCSEEIYKIITEHRVRIVYISPDKARCPVPHIYYDQEAAGFFAADHLIAQGCKDIVFWRP